MGVTFIYAGLLKLVSADYLNSDSPSGVLKQMQGAVLHSPISFILTHAIEHSSLAGIAIAVGELFVGLGILFGIWTRLAALAGFVLSLSFLLTVSWGTYPYFFGPDIVFMAAFTPLMIAGDGGLYSVEALIRNRVRAAAGVSPSQILNNAPVEKQIARRTLIQSGAVAGGLGVVGLATGVVGRKMNKAQPTVIPSASPTNSATSTSSPSVKGTKVATISDVPIGTAFQFSDPVQGAPAYLLQPSKGTFLAYSAICTHEGCPVNYDHGLNGFACPCHGAQFDATTGAATRGPAKAPLQKFNVTVSGTDLYIA
jgi:thiosulfate dehydrogenase [quinone] large subunit